MYLLPPILDSVQPSFVVNESGNYKIYFTLPQVISKSDFQSVFIKVIYQQNSQNAVMHDANHPNDLIYTETINPEANGRYSVVIAATDLQEGWVTDTIYKVQLKLCEQPLWIGDTTEWYEWQKDINTSEWSNIMRIKPINAPTVIIKNQEDILVSDAISGIVQAEVSQMPTFYGYYNTTSNEPLYSYKFDLYNGTGTNLIETSDWVINNQTYNDVTIQYVFNTMLDINGRYRVIFSIRTQNDYEQSSTPYEFVVSPVQEDFPDTIVLTTMPNAENAAIELYLTSDGPISGSYAVLRSDERSELKYYEPVYYLYYVDETLTDDCVFADYAVEDNILYKYALIKLNDDGTYTNKCYQVNNPILVNYEYAYLIGDNGQQLCIKYNNTQSSFKHTVLSAKLDTLGSKYPTINRNGYTYYAEFPITGVISMQMNNDTFFVPKGAGYYYKDSLALSKDKLGNTTFDVYGGHGARARTSDDNIPIGDNEVYIERIFREQAETFLNDGKIKLFKSSTEGLLLVTLLNVSLSPFTNNRMIYSFSATAYEVAEYNRANLEKYNIVNINKKDSSEQEEELSTDLIGQFDLLGLDEGQDNIYAVLSNQLAVKGYTLHRLKMIWVNTYDTNTILSVNNTPVVFSPDTTTYYENVESLYKLKLPEYESMLNYIAEVTAKLPTPDPQVKYLIYTQNGSIAVLPNTEIINNITQSIEPPEGYDVKETMIDYIKIEGQPGDLITIKFKDNTVNTFALNLTGIYNSLPYEMNIKEIKSNNGCIAHYRATVQVVKEVPKDV